PRASSSDEPRSLPPLRPARGVHLPSPGPERHSPSSGPLPAKASAGARRRLPRHQPDHRGPRLGGHHWIDPARTMTAIFGAVYGVDLVIESGVDIRESNILLDAAGLDAAFAAQLRPAVPGGAVSGSRS